MRNVVYTDRFTNDVANIHSSSVLETLDARLEAIERFPLIGTANARPYLTQRFGSDIRLFPVATFIIVYRFIEKEDRVEFIALPHSKMVR